MLCLKMSIQEILYAKPSVKCFLALHLLFIEAQKKIVVEDLELNVVVIGDIGYPENKSEIKRMVVRAIRSQHAKRPFQLGLNQGDNVYNKGSVKNDFQTLHEIFGVSFPPDIYPFDFLTVVGNHDHKGDLDTQIEYHRQHEPRFYMPSRNYYYGKFLDDIDVVLMDGTSIRFVCVDSTPLYEFKPETAAGVEERILQTSGILRILDNSKTFDYLFMVLHHNVNDGCGPHRYVPDYDGLLNLITHKHLTAIINGHNHNMQVHSMNYLMFYRCYTRPPIITIGNSARADPITAPKIYNAWCTSPEDGGFGQLIISNDFATFNFITGDGTILKSAKINRVQ
ncbi:hypothetical protein RF11_08768 [Thelohanellus kitauei]|uniref:Calcineurin-like phosphoesterase domain-containing protein n=1 Tax=Thelohanellus kitauei TaxID=669202 RepID=A0A0C2JPI8_THEKT|nr:hypothetical protein RF11_08768 [Thelohanellus kitauei]